MSKWTDLKVRTISAVVMIAGFIAIVEAGITAFSIAMVAAWLILMWEWWGFSHHKTIGNRIVSMLLGGIYITLGILGFWFLYYISFDYKGEPYEQLNRVYLLVIQVAAIDIGGYVFGKWFGKHKLWPSVSPGKTWEGLAGSIIFSVISAHILGMTYDDENSLLFSLTTGTILAILALSGDLLESRMKRKAGLKDSSNLIPGHGGLFDRVDGLLPCAIFIAIPIFMVGIIGALAGSVTGSGH